MSKFSSFLRRHRLHPRRPRTQQPGAAWIGPPRHMQMDAVYLGDGVLMSRLISGHLMLVLGADRSLAPNIIGSGTWEPNITHLLAKLVKPGMSFLDVGANYGYFSILAADLVGPTGRVIAIEANPTLADLAKNSLKINGFTSRSEVHNVAIDDASGERELRVLSSLLGSSSLTLTKEFAKEYNSELEVVSITAATLDEIVDGRQVDVMKIDIEGAELHAFAAAKKTLENNPHIKIIMEYAPTLLGGAEKGLALLELLTSYGFEAKRIHSRGRLTKFRMEEARALPHGKHADLYLRPSKSPAQRPHWLDSATRTDAAATLHADRRPSAEAIPPTA